MAKKKHTAPLSRYDRVKLILNTAQGDCAPDYDGYHRFWELPIEELKEVVIYGVPMIAKSGEQSKPMFSTPPPVDSGGCCPRSGAMLPPKEEPEPIQQEENGGSCCGGGNNSKSEAYSKGRGEASGLIKGLRGEFPFDQTQFPPLLWGTENKVSYADIKFISEWIDDGLPTEDENPHLHEMADLAEGLTEHQRPTKIENELRAESGQLMVRKNIEHLSPEELRRYRAAVKKLKSRNELDRRGFDYWARVHGNSCQHGWEKFFPWHRCLMYGFEQEIQDVDEFITLSYWDWANPRYFVDGNYTIPDAFKLWLEEEDVLELQHTYGLPQEDADLILGKGRGNKSHIGELYSSLDDFCYSVFWDSKQENYYDFLNSVPGLKKAMFDVLENRNPLWCPYRYLTKTSYDDRTYKNKNMNTLQTYHHHYPTEKDMEQILAIDNFAQFGGGSVYNQSFGALDMDPHNTIHIWSGGSNPNFDANNPNDPLEPPMGYMLNNLTTGFDPIFYGHHTNIDRYWAKWQAKHPGLTPDDGNSVLTPFNFLVRDTYDYHKLGYEYAMSTNYIHVGSDLQSRRVKTTKLNINSSVKEQYAEASVRLHNVVQPNQSLIVRVFLNLDHPENDSHLTHPENFVGGFTIFGHGQCIGAEGHCDPPSKKVRKHDIREQHHNTPWNYNLDATACIQELINKGEDDFHINVLAIGTDGQVLTDLLRMDGVSLDFKQ